MSYPRKPILKILLTLSSLLLLTLMFATNAFAASQLEQDAGPYHVIMQMNPENPMVNQSGTMTIIVKNKTTGQPVTGAKVTMGNPTMMGSNSNDGGNMAGMNMSSSMDNQSGMVMQEQSSMGSMSMEPGSYMMQNMNFNQPGQWNQAITISSSLGQSTVNFPITVGKSGPNYVLIGSVAGVVVIAGIIAAVLKGKKK
ncbi:hypothetical protein DEAC_c36780 [Desulfosporosinus acididurans]|uniref:YtkA-like domain-containing protein n=1 Tax=Desulfosporosinus acididurans TaxID=476652 RepID=A0A0J1IID0_9FIRM|nr:hypothetical protein [Desulfosporosinus acididurans]KLU64476.1 hypothetical protein DEAC_c36780 [Desulfosporosinus acididurans]